jgi:RimJ/RimL family protein N-acetyltransferase
VRDATAPRLPLRTARLELRRLLPADRDALLAYRSDPETCRYLPFEPQTAEDVDRYLTGRAARTSLDDADSSLSFGVALAGGGPLVGDVIVFMHSRAQECVEVGWVFAAEHRGHGYATEAAAALLTFAFDEVRAHRVVARMDPANAASARVAERVGMRREALLVEDERVKGEWCDTLYYAMLEREWRASHPRNVRLGWWRDGDRARSAPVRQGGDAARPGDP